MPTTQDRAEHQPKEEAGRRSAETTAKGATMRLARACKDGCGRSMAGYARRRQYHDECPSPEASELRKLRVGEARRIARKKTGDAVNQHRSDGAAIEGRARPKLCLTCFNFPHYRPYSGCPACKLPFAEENPLPWRKALRTAR